MSEWERYCTTSDTDLGKAISSGGSFFRLSLGSGFFLGLGFPGAVVFWRVEVVFKLFSFAFGLVVGFFLGGIIRHLNPLLCSFLSKTSI